MHQRASLLLLMVPIRRDHLGNDSRYAGLIAAAKMS